MEIDTLEIYNACAREGIDKVDEVITNIDSQSIGQTNEKFEGKH